MSNSVFIQPKKSDTALLMKIDDEGSVYINTPSTEKIVFQKISMDRWGEPIYISPFLTSDGQRVAGWKVVNKKKSYVTSVDMINQGEILGHAGLVKTVWGSVDSPEYLVVLESSISNESSLIVFGEVWPSITSVSGVVSAVAGHLDSKKIIVRIFDQGLVLVDRFSGEINLIYEDYNNQIGWFSIYGDRVMICNEPVGKNKATTKIYKINEYATSIISRVFDNMCFVKFDQLGQWVILQNENQEQFIVNMQSGDVFVPEKQTSDESVVLLTEVKIVDDYLMAKIVSSKGGKPVRAEMHKYIFMKKNTILHN